MRRILPSLLVLLLVLSACAASGGAASSSGGSSDPSASPTPSATPSASDDGEDGGSGSGSIEHPTAADEPVLVVSSEGGFLMVDMLAVQLPSFVLLGDGRVILQGMQTLEFPGPALPPLQERTVTEDGIQEILAELEGTGLFTGGELVLDGMQNVVADASNTVFTLNAGGIESRVSVYGLGAWSPEFGEPPAGVDQNELEAHEILTRLNDSLLLIDTALPAEAWESEGWQPYEPDAFLLYVKDVTGQPIEGGDLSEQVREWPIAEDPATLGEEAANFGDGTRCVVAEGEAAALWFTELSQATQMTTWTTDGEDRWSVRARPLLPHEERSCPELTGAG